MTPTVANKKSNVPAVENLSYEKALAELEAISASLESNKLALEETLALYERGQQLVRHCVDLLDKAELRIKQLSGDTLVDLDSEE